MNTIDRLANESKFSPLFRGRRRLFSLLKAAVTLCFILSFTSVLSQNKELPVVSIKDGRLVYAPDSLGNRVPDFSFAGYKASDKPIPFVKPVVYIPWSAGDQTTRIQKAIDHVAGLPIGNDGFRGAIVLEKGIFEIAGGLKIRNSGIVLRGSGTTTILLGTGLDRTTLLRVYGTDDRKFSYKTEILSVYMPVGALKLKVADPSGFKVGDGITITRVSTSNWIKKLGMSHFGGDTGYMGWKEGERDLSWDRTVTGIKGNTIEINAPITTAIDDRYGGGLIHKLEWPGRINDIGIENIKLQSTYDKTNPKDEQHRWMAVTIENARDVWVRQVDFEHFTGSAVAVWDTGSRVTVEDCKSLDPVSEIGGRRRYTFFTEGQQCLFQRSYAEYGYHDFAVGYLASGPNAFVECRSYLPYSFSGAIDSWSSGVLFDIVNIDGNALKFSNRGMEVQGAGWTAANSMFWQCSAALIDCPAPPTAMNWAMAVWSQFSGDGYWYEVNGFIKPRSLFYGQLADRLGEKTWERAKLLPTNTTASSSPTIKQAKEHVEEAKKPQLQLIDWIDEVRKNNPINVDKGNARSVDHIKNIKSIVVESNFRLELKDGRLLINGSLPVGHTKTVQWWRGNVRRYDTEKARPHITRFVPGRVGQGWTDDLEATTDLLNKNKFLVVDHNYGLWYDRRRDDHERVRRMNGEVWAPFYELPFARSGRGLAWDGMSKYDLTKYNHWYWNRLAQFVDLAEQKGLVLYHQNYFQHNILEAGGHYADFPWRTANNVNDTPFPEPVNYAGDKRIFMARQFYDVSDQGYRALHEAYIRKCLDNFSDNANIIQFISAEYTGPLSFMEFWLDVIARWQKETGKDPLIALSATKDVQDAILKDTKRVELIDVIDVRYWWYGEDKEGDTELYAPKGGQNLAPRQHARLVKTPKETFEGTYKAVQEYREKYPDKAVICNTSWAGSFGWAVFMAGGSLMDLPEIKADGFFECASTYRNVVNDGDTYSIFNKTSGERIIYVKSKKSIKVDLTGYEGSFEMIWIDPASGDIVAKDAVKGKMVNEISKVQSVILWIKKK